MCPIGFFTGTGPHDIRETQLPLAQQNAALPEQCNYAALLPHAESGAMSLELTTSTDGPEVVPDGIRLLCGRPIAPTSPASSVCQIPSGAARLFATPSSAWLPAEIHRPMTSVHASGAAGHLSFRRRPAITVEVLRHVMALAGIRQISHLHLEGVPSPVVDHFMHTVCMTTVGPHFATTAQPQFGGFVGVFSPMCGVRIIVPPARRRRNRRRRHRRRWPSG